MSLYQTHSKLILIYSVRRVSVVTAEVLRQHQELIQNTSSDLEERLERIDQQLKNHPPGARNGNGSSEHQRKLEEEKNCTEQCIQICTQVSAHIKDVRQSSLSAVGSCDQVVSTSPPGSETRWPVVAKTDNTLNICQNALNSMITELVSSLRLINENIQALPIEKNLVQDKPATEHHKLVEEFDSVTQLLSVCESASGRATEARTNVFENVQLAEDSHQVIVSTFGDLLSVRNVVGGARSTQWLGQMSDESLQQLTTRLTGRSHDIRRDEGNNSR